MIERRVARWMTVAVAIVAFATYSTTLCRTIYWGDGIELTCVAAVLGVAHPTGYPLFSLLGRAFTELPLGTVGFRLNLMSAVAATALATLVARAVWRLLPRLGLLEANRVVARAWLSAAAGWTVAFSRTIWYQAGLTEVYLLNAAIFAGILVLVARAIEERALRLYWAACFLCALGIGNHTMAAVLVIPALAAVGIWLAVAREETADRSKRRGRVIEEPLARRLVRIGGPALLLGIVGVSVYAYLPLRAAKNPPLNWGDPSSVGRFLWSVQGGEFRRNYLLKIKPGVPFDNQTYPPFLRKRATEWLTWTADQFAPLPSSQTPLRATVGFLILAAAAVGWRTVARRVRILAIFMAILVGLNLFAVAIYNIPDIEGYFFPTHVVAVVCLFVAFTRLCRWAEDRLLTHQSNALAALSLVLPMALWVGRRSECDHSSYDAPERYGREVLDRLPANAMIMTRSDYDIEPLLYQQIVERYRRDVVVFGANFLATPGYAKYFQGRCDPPVIVPVWSRTPEGEETYYKMLVEGAILPNIARRPLYSTWFDPLMKVESERIEIPLLREDKVIAVEERQYFPEACIYRLHLPGAQP
jgi:hypothetical protein